MQVKVNGKDIQIVQGTTVSQLFEIIETDPRGTAIAVNSKIAKKDEWDTRELLDGDDILIIKAAYGG